MSSGPISEQVAGAFVDAHATTPAWFSRNGFTGTAPTRVSLGVYDLFFANPVNPLYANPQVTLKEGVLAAVAPSPQASIASDGTKVTVTISNGTAFADLDFYIRVDQLNKLT